MRGERRGQAVGQRAVEHGLAQLERRHRMQEREARKARDRDRAAASREKEKGKGKDQEKKRAPPTHEAQPDNKRPHLDGRSPDIARPSESNAAPPGEEAAAKPSAG